MSGAARAYDISLDWQEGSGTARSEGFFPNAAGKYHFWAEHRDKQGYYCISRTEEQRVIYVVHGGEHQEHVEPSRWRCEWQPYSAPDVVCSPGHLLTSDDLEAVKDAAVAHHAATRRRAAWKRYMRDNDPPTVLKTMQWSVTGSYNLLGVPHDPSPEAVRFWRISDECPHDINNVCQRCDANRYWADESVAHRKSADPTHADHSVPPMASGGEKP